MVTNPTPEGLIGLANILVSDQSLQSTLAQVLRLSCESVEHCDLASVTLLQGGTPTTIVSTSDVANEVDRGQYDSKGGGPCLSAYRDQAVYRVESTHEDTRWPAFSRTAVEHGVLSTLSVPLVVAGEGLGSMNLYSNTERGFGSADELAITTLSSHASVAVRNAQAYWEVQRLSDQLEEALGNRGVIDQAKGMLMMQQHCDADAAFDLLRKASQRANRPVRDIATELVERAVEGRSS